MCSSQPPGICCMPPKSATLQLNVPLAGTKTDQSAWCFWAASKGEDSMWMQTYLNDCVPDLNSNDSMKIFDCSVQFSKFCHNSAIRCTELFEYCQRLGNAEFIIPAFQVQFTHYPFYIFDILDDSLLHSTGWLKVQRSNTALVNVKIIVMANQIKERGAYSSQKAQNIHWP